MSAPRHRPARPVVALLAAPVLLIGCMTGERPSFDDDSPTQVGTMTGDSAIDALLTRMDAVGDAVFSAEYTGVLTFGGVTTTMLVTQESPTRRSVTIGDVRYLTEPSGTQTCRVSTGICEPDIDAAAVSDTGLTAEYVVGDLAKRLRRDATARIGTTVNRTEQLAGQDAICVDVPVTGGTKEYCALANGVAASYVGGDLTLTMDRYEPVVTEAWFTPSG